MKTKLLLIPVLSGLLVTCQPGLYAQITFQKIMGGSAIDDVYAVQQTTDGGYITAGTTTSIGAGISDVLLIKTDANGDTVWTKSYGGTDQESAYAVRQTTDGGYIVIASTLSFGAGLWDFYLIKTDAAGDTLWTKTYGEAGQNYGYSVQQTTDGGYILAGIKNNGQDNDICLIKTDANGDMFWDKTYGGTNHDEGYAVQQTTDGGYIVTGLTVSFGSGNADVYLIKTNAMGDTLWTKTYGGTETDVGYALQQTTDGGYIVAGYTLSFGTGSADVYLVKTNATGDVLWTKTYGGLSVDYGYSVRQTADGGYIVAGSTLNFGAGNYDVYLIKTNATGDTLWTKTFGGIDEDRGYDAAETVDEGYIVAGYTVGLGAAGVDVYLIKTDVNGNSDCNQNETATVVATPVTLVNNTATIVSSPATVVTSPATNTHSGSTVTTLCTNIGIDEINRESNSIIIYPNPNSGQFNISGAFVMDEIKITDLPGQIIYKAKPNVKDLSLQLNHAGIYFIEITAGKQTITKKVVVCK